MVYKMRFVQTFPKKYTEDFMNLEEKFIALEKKTPGLKQGKRYIPVIGKEPTNTMVWEAEYDSMEAAMEALEEIQGNAEHDRLLAEQIVYMKDTYVELYKEMG